MTHVPPIARPSLPAAPEHTTNPSSGGTRFRDALRDVANDLARGESLVASTLDRSRGAPALDTTQLLALQAGVYHYTQQVDLVSRLVDRATQAVKSTLQNPS